MFDNWTARGRMARVALALALAAGAVGVTVVEGSPAASATAPPLICHKIYGHITTTVVITKCGVAQGGAHFAGPDILTGGTLTWGKSRTTTAYTGTATSPGEGICPAGRVEYDFTGTITGDTSTYVNLGDTVTYDICVNSTTDVVNLIRRTTATF
jgi:hypothetical protein